jgi:hypothetical protein
MTDNPSTRTRLELRPLEVGVGAAAAVLTAFASSYVGTAGTLAGAAVASVVGTVSTSVLRTSAQRTNESLQRTAARLRQTHTGPELGASAEALPGTGTTGGADAPDAPAKTGAETDTAAALTSMPPAARADRRLRWPVLAAGALIAFVAALIAITGVESAVGKPLAALVGRDGGGGTTIGRTLGENPGAGTDAPATPTPIPSTGSSATATEPAGSPSGIPSSTAGPSATATPGATPPPTAVAPSPTPSVGAPAPSGSP